MFNVDLVAKDQFKTDKSKNKVGANKSLFTVAMKFKYMQWMHMQVLNSQVFFSLLQLKYNASETLSGLYKI